MCATSACLLWRGRYARRWPIRAGALAVLMLTGCSAGPALGQERPAVVPADPPQQGSSYAGFVAEAAQRFGVPGVWITAVIDAESAGRARAVSVAGARGLMQVMPATWRMLSVRHGLGADPFDPRANILAGAAFLRAMLERYGSLGLALAAYNAGPLRVDAWLGTGRALPAETCAYVVRVLSGIGMDGGDLRGAKHAVAVPDHLFVLTATDVGPALDRGLWEASPDTSQAASQTDIAQAAAVRDVQLFTPVGWRQEP